MTNAVTPVRQPPSFLRVMLFLAATIVVLAGMRLGAPVVTPTLFALVVSLIFSPIYSWLKRRGLPAPLALLIMLVALSILFVGLFGFLSVSIGKFTGRIAFYTTQLDIRTDELQSLLESLGISKLDLREVVKPGAIVGALGNVLSGLGSFLSDLFLILMITLFLLGEGPAIAARLRASTAPDNPHLARLTIVARGVIRQLGLRAITNFVIGTGITVLFWLLGVDFPLLWGVLAFFLSFVPYIGLPIAAAPGVLLALAEFGVSRALLVILGVIVINQLAEYGLDPFLLSRGLQLSPAIVFLSFTLWAWLLGAPGAFLAMPITLLLAAMFDTFPETRWLANLMTTRPATDPPVPIVEVKRTG
jgi:predicted PurR-regulated permease PerM